MTATRIARCSTLRRRRVPGPSLALAAGPSLAIALGLGLGACNEEPPPPAAAAPEAPKIDRAQQLAEARARVEALKEENRQKMRAAGEGSVTRLRKVGDKLEMHFVFKNKGDKPMTQADGSIALLDASGTLLKQMRVPFQEPIAAGKSVKKRGRFPIDKAEEGEVALAKSKLRNLTVVWKPKLYRFEDGTTMQAD